MDSYIAAKSRGANSLAQRGLRDVAQEDRPEIQKYTRPPHIHCPWGTDIDTSAITEVNVKRPPKSDHHRCRDTSAGKVEAPTTTSEDSKCSQSSSSGYTSDKPAAVKLPSSVPPTQQACDTHHKADDERHWIQNRTMLAPEAREQRVQMGLSPSKTQQNHKRKQ